MFYFLEDRERRELPFTLEELAEATGYKMSSIFTYYGKRLKGVLAEEQEDGTLRAMGLSAFTEETFIDYLTQRSSPDELSAVTAPSALAAPRQAPEAAACEALLDRAAGAFKVALELYARELGGAHLALCVASLTVAWDALLRAELLRIRGAQTLTERRTLSELLPRFFPDVRDPARKNVEWLARLTTVEAPLLFEELTPYLSRLLLASALAFRARWEAVTGRALLKRAAARLALGVEGRAHTLEELEARYGSAVSDALSRLIEELAHTERELGSARFSVPVERQAVWWSAPQGRDEQERLGEHEGTRQAARQATQLLEAISAAYPYSPGEVAHEINRRLPYELRVSASAIELIDRAYKVRTVRRSPLYMRLDEPERHLYSESYVEWVVKAMASQPEWLKRAHDTARRMEE